MPTACAHRTAGVQHLRLVRYRLWWMPWRTRTRLICSDCKASDA
jgi:hypothetical protein